MNQQTSNSKILKWSMPGLMLRLEGTAVLLASLWLYGRLQFNWGFFFLLFLAPDAALLVYLANKRLGIVIYNLLHTYALPISLVLAALLFNWSGGVQLALIWLAHIGMDRFVGYGLKYSGEFSDTHLSRV